jgi:hypothetical protein
MNSGYDTSRDGDKSSACARFVSIVLNTIGVKITPSPAYDYVPDLEKFLLNNGATKITDRTKLLQGDVVLVTSIESNSGFHVGIFDSIDNNYVSLIQEPGLNAPVRVGRYASKTFVAGYRVMTCG